MDEIIYKYFKDSETLHFHSSDAHSSIEGDTYLRYRKNNSDVELWIGGNNGEVCLICTDDIETLEMLIKIIINGYYIISYIS